MRRTTWAFSWATVGLLTIGGFANGQVFTQADGAVEGPAQPGEGQALYGGFGLNSATDPEFNIYRKYLRRETDEPLSSATNVDGNPGEAEWINVNQRQAGTLAGSPSHVLTAPGMFIGTKTHTTEDGWVVSNPNEILYFKPLIDNEEDLGLTDSNRNALWDARFGFMENAEDYIDFVEPNSEQLDLWTGQLNTDAVYLQNAIQRDDSREITNVTSQVGHGGSFKLQSGSDFTSIANEQGRVNNEIERIQAGTEEELDRTGQLDAGVAYEDAIEVTWGMRLNDPDSNDEFFAREVEFWVKTGNIIARGIFDPGGGEDSPTDFPPNEPNDVEDYTDFVFDWQNSVPVFFAGAQGLAQGTGNMGMFIPGDFGADGAVNLDDFDRLASNYNGEATTYSRGDFTQDGLTNLDDITAWADLADATVKAAALGAVEADVTAGGSAYDFDGSGGTDASDVSFITGLFGELNTCTPGADFNGDGQVSFPDFLLLSANFGQAGGKAEGDADCDGNVAFPDFLLLSAGFGQPAGASAAASVPEPTAGLLMLTGFIAFAARRRRR